MIASIDYRAFVQWRPGEDWIYVSCFLGVSSSSGLSLPSLSWILMALPCHRSSRTRALPQSRGQQPSYVRQGRTRKMLKEKTRLQEVIWETGIEMLTAAVPELVAATNCKCPELDGPSSCGSIVSQSQSGRCLWSGQTSNKMPRWFFFESAASGRQWGPVRWLTLTLPEIVLSG